MNTRSIRASARWLLIVNLGLSSSAQGTAETGKGTGEIAAAANKFLASLDQGQRDKVVFDFKDEAQRKRWSNLPAGIFRREALGQFRDRRRRSPWPFGLGSSSVPRPLSLVRFTRGQIGPGTNERTRNQERRPKN